MLTTDGTLTQTMPNPCPILVSDLKKYLKIKATGHLMFRSLLIRTVLYTSYMTSIVATRPVAEGFAVLLPCFWVYMHVGKCMLALRNKLGDSVHRPPQYDAWIDMYGGDEFERDVNEFIALVDGVAEGAGSETLKRMEEHFMMSCRLEYLFWDQAQCLMQWSI